MMVDFRDAAERHWKDAGTLMGNNRLANADHLLGLAAECALKAVMLALGMRLQDGRPRERQHRVHINKLWDEFVRFANGQAGARYAAMMSGQQNPFDNWVVDQRYFGCAYFTQAMVVSHEQGAGIALSVMEGAVQDGMIL